jgi:hypothetical protein
VAILVILILLALWGAVLLPPILRARAESGSAPGGIGDFVGRLRTGLGQGRHHDGALPPLQPIMGPVGGPSPALGTGMRAPGGMSPMQRRRRDVLVGLLAAVGLTFLMAFMGGSIFFWVLQLLADALLAGYVCLLLQVKAKHQQRRQQSRPAPLQIPMPVPSNVHHLDPMRRRTVAIPSHVEAPREATVLALRRTATW